MEIRFVLTANCNYDCYFCLNEYVGGKNSKYSLLSNDYTFATHVSKEELGISKITLTGGEPLIREDIENIVPTLKETGAFLTLVTNGSLLNKRIAVPKHLDELHVSFHSLDEDNWRRITRRNGNMSKDKVLQNLEIIRERYPNLLIKINVVSERANNSQEAIAKYIELASRLKLEINVFKEGYTRIAKFFNTPYDYPEPEPLWDIQFLAPSLVEKKPRKSIYFVKNVKISLSNTSTDESSWDSLWIGPTGVSYCDVFQRTPAIDLSRIIASRNQQQLCIALNSLLEEASLRKSIRDNIQEENTYSDLLNKVINDRIANFDTTNMLI